MNVLEKIKKNISECQKLGIDASKALSLSIYDSSIMEDGCILLLDQSCEAPEILKKEFDKKIVNGLQYYTHKDYVTTFVFSNKY